MDVKKALIDTIIEVLPIYGLLPIFKGESFYEEVVSADDVSVVMGLSGDLKGNMIITVNRSAVLKIVSSMMCGIKITKIDDMVKSAMGELLNIIAGNALIKIKANSAVHISPPTIIIGEKVFMLISSLKSRKLTFQMDEHYFNVAFFIE